jgi:hypothetical protein
VLSKPDGPRIYLCGLTREELAYILDTFPIVRRKDEERWGEAWKETYYEALHRSGERWDVGQHDLTPGTSIAWAC